MEYALKTEKAFSEPKIFKVVTMVALGLEQAHHQGILHKQISSTLVQMADQNAAVSARLSNFAIATIAEKQKADEAFYTSPEVAARRTPYNAKAEVWALGVLLLEMIQPSLKPKEGQTPVSAEQVRVEELEKLSRHLSR